MQDLVEGGRNRTVCGNFVDVVKQNCTGLVLAGLWGHLTISNSEIMQEYLSVENPPLVLYLVTTILGTGLTIELCDCYFEILNEVQVTTGLLMLQCNQKTSTISTISSHFPTKQSTR